MGVSVQGKSKIESAVGKPGFLGFSKVHSFTFLEEGIIPLASKYSLELILESERMAETFRLHLRFTGVQSFELHEFGGGWTQIMGFDIVDVSDRQWDKIKFEVIDYEDQRLSFFCETVEVLAVVKVE